MKRLLATLALGLVVAATGCATGASVHSPENVERTVRHGLKTAGNTPHEIDHLIKRANTASKMRKLGITTIRNLQCQQDAVTRTEQTQCYVDFMVATGQKL